MNAAVVLGIVAPQARNQNIQARGNLKLDDRASSFTPLSGCCLMSVTLCE